MFILTIFSGSYLRNYKRYQLETSQLDSSHIVHPHCTRIITHAFLILELLPFELFILEIFSGSYLRNFKTYQLQTSYLDSSQLVDLQCARTITHAILILELLPFDFFKLKFSLGNYNRCQLVTSQLDSSQLVHLHCAKTITLIYFTLHLFK